MKRFPAQIKEKRTNTQTGLSRCPEYFRNFLVPPKLFWSKKVEAVFIINYVVNNGVLLEYCLKKSFLKTDNHLFS